MGNFVYPFKMQTPIWLPQSLHLKTESNSLRIRYQLEVCYEPLKYVVQKRDIFIFFPAFNSLPPPSKMDAELSATMASTVGGIFGKSECETTVYFEKTQYCPGEKVKFTLECDNSQCKSGVKNFKIKLQRKWIGFVDEVMSQKSEYLKVLKVDGTPAKTWLKRSFEFVLPYNNEPVTAASPISDCLTQSF